MRVKILLLPFYAKSFLALIIPPYMLYVCIAYEVPMDPSRIIDLLLSLSTYIEQYEQQCGLDRLHQLYEVGYRHVISYMRRVIDISSVT